MDKDEVFTRALRMLNRRALTRRELSARLAKKFGAGDVIEEVISELDEAGFIDERAIVEDSIRAAKEYKLAGRALVRQAMYERGVRRELVKTLLNEGYPECEEIKIIRLAVESRARRLRDLPPDKRMRSLAGYLNRRGFSAENISAVLREFAASIMSD